MNQEIRKLSERDHIISRPNMYIGAVDSTTSYDYILENDKIIYKEISYIPALVKIINEILDNSIDVAIKTDFKSSNIISIKFDSESVEVQDNGTGIPVVKNSDGHFLPELAWGHARAGSNFGDDKTRTQIGMNGVGSFATNCFSTKFIGKTDDGKKSYTITFKDNAESFKESVKETSGETGTTVKFWPDFEKLSVDCIDEIHQNIIKQRLLNLSITFPEITFKFNGKKVNSSSFKKYIQLFNEVSEVHETDNFKFAIVPNDSDDFRHFSYVNGLKIPDGGVHVDTIMNNIVGGIRDKLVKKYKSIKPGDIRNKLMLVVFIKNFPNTKFNSQSKEKLTNSIKEFNDFIGDVNYDKIVAKLLKTPEILDPITEVYRIKEEFKKRQDLKGLSKGVKKIKSEKYLPAINKKKYLFITEGQCLEEHTEVLLPDFTSTCIKNIKIGDNILGPDGSKREVLGITKLLKPTITFSTAFGNITCTKKHKFQVYDTYINEFALVQADKIQEDINRYKFIKSKLNTDTVFSEINEIVNNTIYCESGIIQTTDDDFFMIYNDVGYIRKHVKELELGDKIIFYT